jgi:hypothetical protein
MVIAPNDLFSWNNKYNKYCTDIYTLSSWSYARELTLCMLAFWSHEGVVFLDFLPSPHLVTSFHLPCLGSTDAHCPRLGDPIPLHPKWRPFSQGLRTLPYRDPVQVQISGCSPLLTGVPLLVVRHGFHIVGCGGSYRMWWLIAGCNGSLWDVMAHYRMW